MPGDERRHQLVAQLLGRHLAFVLVASRQQGGEDIFAGLVLGRWPAVGTRGPPLRDHGKDQVVGVGHQPVKAPLSRSPAQPALQRRQYRQWTFGEREHIAQQLAQPAEGGSPLQAEDRSQDDLERQRLQPRVQGDVLPGRPGGHLALADLGHHFPQTLHPLAVKGGQKQPALSEVNVLVEQDDRVATDDRSQDRRALARMYGIRGGGEQRLDVGRIGEDHERRLERELDGHPPPVAPQTLQRGRRPRPGPQQLQHAWNPWSRWQHRPHVSYHRPSRLVRAHVAHHQLSALAGIAA